MLWQIVVYMRLCYFRHSVPVYFVTMLRKEYTSVFFILLADLRSDHTSPVHLLVTAALLHCHSAALHDVTPARSYAVANLTSRGCLSGRLLDSYTCAFALRMLTILFLILFYKQRAGISARLVYRVYIEPASVIEAYKRRYF